MLNTLEGDRERGDDSGAGVIDAGAQRWHDGTFDTGDLELFTLPTAIPSDLLRDRGVTLASATEQEIFDEIEHRFPAYAFIASNPDGENDNDDNRVTMWSTGRNPERLGLVVMLARHYDVV